MTRRVASMRTSSRTCGTRMTRKLANRTLISWPSSSWWILNKTSPFKDQIRLFDLGKQKLTLKGLSGYDLRGLVSPKGLLRQYNAENETKEYLRILRLYFNTIHAEFKTEWENPDKYLIATNRGITAFLKI